MAVCIHLCKKLLLWIEWTFLFLFLFRKLHQANALLFWWIKTNFMTTPIAVTGELIFFYRIVLHFPLIKRDIACNLTVHVIWRLIFNMNQNLISKLIMKTNATIYTINAYRLSSGKIVSSKLNPHKHECNSNSVDWKVGKKWLVVLSTQINHAK